MFRRGSFGIVYSNTPKQQSVVFSQIHQSKNQPLWLSSLSTCATQATIFLSVIPASTPYLEVKPKHIFRGPSRNQHDLKMCFVALKHFLPYCTSPPLKQAICDTVRITLLIISCAWKWCALITSHATGKSCATESKIYVTPFSSAQNTMLYLIPLTLLSTQAEGGRRGGLKELKDENCMKNMPQHWISSYVTTIQALAICTKGRGK